MKNLLFLFPVFLVSGSAWAVPSFDPFANATANGGTSYGIGSTLTNQFNNTLSSPWYSRGTVSGGALQPMIVVGNLAYPNMPSSSGNSVSFVPGPNVGACIDLGLAATHTDTVYYSFLLKITDISTVPTTPSINAFAFFLDDPAPQAGNVARRGTRLLTKKITATTYVLGTSRSDSVADFVYEPDGAAHNVGDVLFVVGCYQRTGGVSTNVSLWVNPPSSSLGSNQPPAPTLVAPFPASFAGGLNNNSARAFGIICQFPEAPTGVIDDVRVAANDWSYVTGGDPSVLTQPVSLTQPEGSSANFAVTARGTPTLTYQWYKDGVTPLSDGGKIAGASTTSLTINNISSAEVGDYSVTVVNGNSASATSSKAHLSLTDPLITSQPQSRTNNYGTTATFQVTATGTGPLKYRWSKTGVGNLSDGGNIIGSQSNQLAVTGVTLSDAGTYFVTVTNGLNTSVDSSTAELTVLDPFFVTQPTNITASAGANVAFHVAASGSGGPFTYQWRKGGNLLFDGGNVSGANTATLAISNISPADGTNYDVVVIGATTITSTNVVLTVLNPVSITVPVSPRTVLPGSKVVFSVIAAGSAPLSYQWRSHGTNIPGANSYFHTVPNAQAADAGSYAVIVSNSINSVTNATTLTVNPNLQLYPTNIVVIRVGDGEQALTINGNSIALDQYTPSGSYVNTVNIPDSGASGMTAIGWDNINGVNAGSTTGSCLTRSLDGRFMVVAGYNTNLSYGASLALSTAASVPRGIALVDSYAQYSLAVSSTDPIYNQTFWRAGVTDGTNNYWGASGVAGTYYFGFDAAPVLVQSTLPNLRSMGLFNGDIYCASAAGATPGILKLTGMPTTAVAPPLLFAGSTGTFDLMVSPNGNLIYVTDQRAVSNSGGVQRWDFDGMNWTLTYTLNTGFGNLGPRYVTADFSGANPVLYVTSNDQTFDNNRIIMVTDTGAGSAGVTLVRAGVNQTFRGLRFGPVQNTVLPRPTLSYAQQGGNLILSWTGAFTLMSATNVAGPYVDVIGATNPYTNAVTPAAQRYFGLRQ